MLLLGVKVHPEVFPLATHNYVYERRQAVNMSNATTEVVSTFLVEKNGLKYRVIIFRYFNGVLLGDALNRGDISRSEAKGKLLNLLERINSAKVYLYFYDANDFIITESGALMLMDWCAIADVSGADEAVMDAYIDVQKHYIDEFLDNHAEKEKRNQMKNALLDG